MDDTVRNAAQIEAWNGDMGQRWAARQVSIDALFAEVTAALLALAAPAPGERVLDVGCGAGATVLAAARAVGPGGAVTGVDVSAPLLDVARARLAEAGLGHAGVTLADAAIHPFAPGGVDLAMSRFGVMFFDDPVAAFANIRATVRPGGRLAVACWRPLAENGWFKVPIDAVLPLVGPQPAADPDAAGPFGLARTGRAETLLRAAGWHAVTAEPREVRIRLAGPGDIEAATEFVTAVVGATARLLAAADPAVRPRARAAVAERLRAFDGPEGVVLGGAIWLVSARA